MIDFANLNSEYDSLSQHTTQSMTTVITLIIFLLQITNLSNYFKSVHYYSETFYNNTKKSIELLFNDLIKYDNKSTLSKGIFDHYRNYESYMAKVKQINK